jgi:hypothetical protein
LDPVGESSSDVGALGQGAISRREDLRSDVLDGGEDLIGIVNPGSKEFRANQRLDGGAVIEALRQFGKARDKTLIPMSG